MSTPPSALLDVAKELIDASVLGAWLTPDTVVGTWLAEGSLPVVWGDVSLAHARLGACSSADGPYPPHAALMLELERELGLEWSPEAHELRRTALASLPSDIDPQRSTAATLGAMTFGAPLVFFAEWVADSVEREGFDMVACLMREGAMFAPLLERTLSRRDLRVPVSTFYASRRSTLCLEHEQATDGLLQSLIEHRSTPLSAIPELLGQHPLRSSPSDERSLRAWYDAAESRMAIARWLADQRRAFQRYAATALQGARRVAFVDVGMKGTLARRLCSALEARRPAFFYWMAASETHRLAYRGVDVRGFAAGPFHQVGYGRIYDRSSEVCEQLWMGEEGSTLAYADDGETGSPVLGPRPPKRTVELRHACRAGVLAVSRAYEALDPSAREQLTRDARTFSAAMLTRLVRFPAPLEVELVDAVGVEDNMGDEARRPLLTRAYRGADMRAFLIRNRLAFESDAVRWPEGEVVAVSPETLRAALAEQLLELPDPRNGDVYEAGLRERAGRVSPGARVIILGAGQVARTLGERLVARGAHIVAFVDASARARGVDALLGSPVIDDEGAARIDVDEVLVGTFAHEALLRGRFEAARASVRRDHQGLHTPSGTVQRSGSEAEEDSNGHATQPNVGCCAHGDTIGTPSRVRP
jgi:hypothetical protein